MIAVDTSAILAILCNEEESHRFNEILAADDNTVMSAANYAEAGIVLQKRYGPAGLHYLLLLVTRARIAIEPVDAEQAEAAIRAYAAFGKGNHEAGLNFGDCFAYALARQREIPLLFRGEDFGRCDVTPAV
ncbi:MAG: type II toxin-antitoxin system VapC family toxin [bacterium]